MKIQWSAFFSVLALTTLIGCGAEQFGSTPQTESNTISGPQGFQQLSCTTHTLIRPKVDILYLIDNTESYYYSSDSLKAAINGTLNQVSNKFDYRLITTTLVNPKQDTWANLSSAPDNSEFRVFTNSDEQLPSEIANNKVISVSELTSFITPLRASHSERGLWRMKEFMKRHASTGLLRRDAYNLVVLISNNRDTEVESINANGANEPISGMLSTRFNELNAIKTQLNSKELRLFSISAKSRCRTDQNWIPATHSYQSMSGALHKSATLPNFNPESTSGLHNDPDAFDLCSGSFTDVFASVNASIQQIVIPHTYSKWPISFAKETDTRNSFGEIKVFKTTGNTAPVLMNPSLWNWYQSPTGSENIRSDGGVELISGKFFISFTQPISYPDCIQIQSSSRTEYFKYIVLPKQADKNSPISVRINGNVVNPANWSYRGYLNTNVKADYPNPGDNLPTVLKSGYMIEITNPASFYKSGDSVEVNYKPAPIN